MNYLKQFLIILAVSLLGEICKACIPLPIPASIYGMVFMFVFLLTGIIKLSQVKDAGKFLIEIMPVMFIPAGVGLMASWNVLQTVLLPVSVITVITIFTVMASTGLISQAVINRKKKASDDVTSFKEAA
ncbi:CidA/LrgA family protein [Butyrivibrio sp. JL13D10]|uniref:CidA/LrgA family protein n=1 Tax=Butyrivibrio sp. JL13D10 TaxID=3236815 RepID=UPI0038B4D25F